jgi:hypothetical protein
VKLKNLFEWNNYDDLSYHHAAGASEADVEEEMSNMMEYLGDPEMQEYIQKYYPAFSRLSVDKQAARVLFAKVSRYTVMDHLDDGPSFDEFENIVEDAMKVIEKDLSN